MKLLSLTCNQCGAPLEVPEQAKYLTCQFCESRLQVHQTSSAAYTEVLESLVQKTDKIADEVAVLRLQNSLHEIDRDWDRQKQTYMVKGKDGHMSIPSKVGAVVTGLMGGVIGLVVMASGSQIDQFGILIVGVSLFASMYSFQRAADYDRLKTRHQKRRLEIINQMNQS